MKTAVKQTVSAAGARKARQKKIIIGSIAVTATGILGYFGWKYYLKKKDEKEEPPFSKKDPVYFPPPSPPPAPPPRYIYVKEKEKPQKKGGKPTGNNIDNYIPDAPVSEFPLKRGSRNEKVRLLQEALIAKHGRQVFPKYGADGQFGPEMAAGLAKLKLPSVITESVFNVLVQGAGVNSDPLAGQLKNAAEKKDFSKAVGLLKKIKNTDGYTEVNNEFKTMRINGGVRQTVVNAMLNVFSKPEQKEAIRLEFLRMGLKYDGKKWSLSGLDGLPLITTRTAKVWINARESVDVPSRMVLGNEITRRNDYILFENRGRYFLIHQNSVKYV